MLTHPCDCRRPSAPMMGRKKRHNSTKKVAICFTWNLLHVGTVHGGLLEDFWQKGVRTCRTTALTAQSQRDLTVGGGYQRKVLLFGSHDGCQNQLSVAHSSLVPRSVALAHVYLLRVHGEDEHDGEARQQAGVLDGEGDEEAAAARFLFLPTHLVHLWELGDTR